MSEAQSEQDIIFDNSVDSSNDIPQILACLTQTVDNYDKALSSHKIESLVKAKDFDKIKSLMGKSKGSLKVHHINHAGAVCNVPEVLDFIAENKLGDIYADEYEYLVPFCLLAGSNTYAEHYIKNAPASYVLNDKNFAHTSWYFFAARSGNVDGIKLLSDANYVPVQSKERNKHNWEDAILCGLSEADSVEVLEYIINNDVLGKRVELEANYGVFSQAIALTPSTKVIEYMFEKLDYANHPYAWMTVAKLIEQVHSPQTLPWKKEAISKALAYTLSFDITLTHIIKVMFSEDETHAYVANKMVDICVNVMHDHLPKEKQGPLAQQLIGNWNLRKMDAAV